MSTRTLHALQNFVCLFIYSFTPLLLFFFLRQRLTLYPQLIWNSVQTKLASNSKGDTSVCAGIKGGHHHIHLAHTNKTQEQENKAKTKNTDAGDLTAAVLVSVFYGRRIRTGNPCFTSQLGQERSREGDYTASGWPAGGSSGPRQGPGVAFWGQARM